MNRQDRLWHALRRAFAVLFCAFTVLPLAVILAASFTDAGYISFPPPSLGLRWYVAALQDSTMMSAFAYSLKIAVVVAALSGMIGVLGAVALAHHDFSGRDAILGVIMMPLALPHIVIAIALLQLVSIVSVPIAPHGLVAGHVLFTLPFVVRLTLTSLVGLNPQLAQASYSLGASAWQTFRRVTLPLIAPGAMAGIVFAFLLSFDEVTLSIFLSLPGHTTLPAELFNYASQGDDPVITAVSGLMIILATVLMLLVERFFGVLRLMSNEQTA